jgi:DNA-binding response OmpR family regulator
MHLLVVEDDPRLGRLLLRLFNEDRHVVELASRAPMVSTLKRLRPSILSTAAGIPVAS